MNIMSRSCVFMHIMPRSVFASWQNSFCQLAKFILPAGKTYFASWQTLFASWQNSFCQAIPFCQLGNSFCQLAKLILPAGKTHFASWKFHFASWQNSFCQLAITILPAGKKQLPLAKARKFELTQLRNRSLRAEV